MSHWKPSLVLCLAAGLCAAPPPGVVLLDTPLFTATRHGRYFVVTLRTPHRVLSTSSRGGGQSESLRYLVNHQSMEPAYHLDRHDKVTGSTPEHYHDTVAAELSLPPLEMAIMGTAANMNYLAHQRRQFRDLTVDAFVTAGVEANATRAGDPAKWYEEPPHGTINIILLLNRPLTAGALARAVMVVTEAKSAALAELATPSGVSSHLATGTGTDQFILAAPLTSGQTPLRHSGAHSKLGELIGDSVRAAVREALRWQNGLEASYTRSITRALGRFGLTEKVLLARLEARLPKPGYELLVRNRLGVTMEPRLAAATYAYAAVLDRLQYGTVPRSLAGELLRDQAASVAVALSTKPERWPVYWKQLPASTGDDLLEPYLAAVALGWQNRWAE